MPGFPIRASKILLLASTLSAGCGGSDSGGTGPTPAPVVVTVTPGRDTLTVATSATFNAAVTGSDDHSVTWTVQEGASGGSVSPAGLYTASGAPGTYHVIAASTAKPSSTDTATIQVVAAPNATITAPANVGTGMAGQSASVPVQAGSTYQWSITGGTITAGGTSAAVTFTPGAVGPLTLQCTVTNLAGTSTTGSKAIAIQPIPTITSFTASKSIVTYGQTVTLTAVFTGGTGTINQGVGAVASGVAIGTGPLSSPLTYFILTVSSPFGLSITDTATVNGAPPPSISRFAAVQRVVGAGDIANLQPDFGPFAESQGTVDNGVGTVDNGLLRATGPLLTTTTFVLSVKNAADSTITASWQVPVQPRAPGSFGAAGTMPGTRFGFTATLLANGQILIVGGDNYTGQPDSALLYNPTTHGFQATGQMTQARNGHAAVRLGNGKVLVTGGGTASAELYDPVTGTFTATGNMTTVRSGQTMTLLANGRVLVIGGDGFPASAGTAELYDPATGTFAATGSLSLGGRTRFSAVRLQDGRVLVALGDDAAGNPLLSTETYDPGTGTFTARGSLAAAHQGGSATLLQNGKVLVAGGWNGASSPTTADFGMNPTAELFDPSTNQFSVTGMLAYPRREHAAVLRADGSVLLGFGNHSWSSGIRFAVPPAEIYNPVSGTFHPGASVLQERETMPAGGILVPSGRVIFFGEGVSAETEEFQ